MNTKGHNKLEMSKEDAKRVEDLRKAFSTAGQRKVSWLFLYRQILLWDAGVRDERIHDVTGVHLFNRA
jgi:hypothetical protein